MKLLLGLAVLLTSYMVQAENVEQCQFQLSCVSGLKTFALNFKSKSGDCTEDDMGGTFEIDGRSKSLEMKPNWYFYTDHISKNLNSVCKDPKQLNPFAAYAVTKDQVLLFVKASGRPTFDRVLAILFDTNLEEVLDTQELGKTRNQSIAVLKNGKGFKTRIIRDSLSFPSEVTCDCDAAFVDDWMNVSVKKGKISASWIVK